MSFDPEALEPRIRAILTAPGVDLGTISAKRVRKTLLEEDPTLNAEDIREHRETIDNIVRAVYDEIVQAQTQEAEGEEEAEEDAVNKRKREDEEDAEAEETKAAPSSKQNKKKRAKKETERDEEIARQLNEELNSRSRRAGTTKAKKVNGTKRGKKIKSAATVDSDGEAADKPKRRAGGGLSKEYTLSQPLASLLNVDKLSRPQVVKQIWVYIKERNLQNPEDKREILCDEAMKGVFHVDKVSMFKMNKMLSQHLLEPHESSS